jgi:hypothetical protein
MREPPLFFDENIRADFFFSALVVAHAFTLHCCYTELKQEIDRNAGKKLE